MELNLEWWNKKHHKYATEDWINKPSIFAKWAIQYFPKNGSLLELGAGHGQDSRYFAFEGYNVTSTDFSESAINYNLKKTEDVLSKNVNIQNVDISKPLPYPSESYDVVYCHLSIHYFNEKTTTKVFAEIYRVLKPEGVLAVLVNSIKDPEYGTGIKLDTDFYELSPGDIKHFFSTESLKEMAKKFGIIALDDSGTTYKDSAKGVFNLIRFIGQKSE